MTALRIGTIVRTILFICITFIATVLLVIETPATGGYFNLGEASIYAIAATASPWITAIAAGLGPALADLVLGYWYFAPATFVIKFCEGFIVSTLIGYIRRKGVTLKLRILTIVVAIALGIVVATLSLGGGLYMEAYFTWTPTKIFGVEIAVPSVYIALPPVIWIVIAVLIAYLGIVIALIARWRPYILAMSVGGLIMVTGYFLYEYFVSNPLILHREAILAITEVPVNVGQFTVGILLSYPVVQFIERAKGIKR